MSLNMRPKASRKSPEAPQPHILACSPEFFPHYSLYGRFRLKPFIRIDDAFSRNAKPRRPKSTGVSSCYFAIHASTR